LLNWFHWFNRKKLRWLKKLASIPALKEEVGPRIYLLTKEGNIMKRCKNKMVLIVVLIQFFMDYSVMVPIAMCEKAPVTGKVCAGSGSDCTNNNNTLVNARIVSDDLFTTCSGDGGNYGLEVNVGNRTLNYRKSGYKTITQTFYVPPIVGARKDACLQASDATHEIAGTVTWNKEGIAPQDVLITLYSCTDCTCNGCTCETQIDSVLTCSDGNFSFPDLAEEPYKIVPSFTGCQFSPANYTISIPQNDPQSFNFSGTCQ
jgi:hypothetical protein